MVKAKHNFNLEVFLGTLRSWDSAPDQISPSATIYVEDLGRWAESALRIGTRWRQDLGPSQIGGTKEKADYNSIGSLFKNSGWSIKYDRKEHEVNV